MFYLETRNKKVYMRMTNESWEKPEYVTSFWKTDLQYHEEYNGLMVFEFSSGAKYVNCFDKKISVVLESEMPEFTEFSPIKPPSKKHFWKYGEWRKY